jgi:hypothetical protein
MEEKEVDTSFWENYITKEVMKEFFPDIEIESVDVVNALEFTDSYERVIIRIACNGWKDFYHLRIAPNGYTLLFVEEPGAF